MGTKGGRLLFDGGVDFRNRVLLTRLGVWNRQDPLGYVDGGNLYAYVQGNPATFGDPSGLTTTFDLNPYGPRPPKPFGGEVYHPSPDEWINHPNILHLSMFGYYNSPNRDVDDNYILPGEIMAQIMLLPQIQNAMATQRQIATNDIKNHLTKVECGDSFQLTDRGSILVTIPLSTHLNLRLALQRFYIYYETKCNVGPTECNPGCGEGERDTTTAPFSCETTWTVYDIYDFEIWEPYSWAGTPFHVFGSFVDGFGGDATSGGLGKPKPPFRQPHVFPVP